LSGRFGQIHKTTELFLNATFAETSKVFTSLYKSEEPTLEEEKQQILEDPEGEGYRAKLGRWRREALAAANDVSVWRKMAMTHVCRGPVMHLVHWLEAELNKEVHP